MRRIAPGFFVLVAAVASAGAPARQGNAAGRPWALPASFEPNVGQAPAGVRFVAHGPGYAIALRETGADIVVCSEAPRCRSGGGFVRLLFEGANPHARLAGEDALPGRTNFLRGTDPAAWRTNVVTYRRVRYRDLWPGIDVVYRGSAGALEYDFVLSPGADPRRIALRYENGRDVALDRDGNLVIATAAGELIQRKPVLFQVKEGRREEIGGRFELESGGRVRFAVSGYDRTRELVIDPTLAYSTYLGDWFVYGMAVDAAGNVFVVGTAISPALTPGIVPPATGLQKTFGGGTADAFIVKVAARGGEFLWATYLGGTGDDEAAAVAVDSEGNACVAGRTFSLDFPYKNGFQTRGNVFVSKISADGSRLLSSTGFGGSGEDVVNAIVVDSSGAISIAGEAGSPDFPTLNAFQTARKGPSDAFVAKIGPAGSLVYSTLLGGDSFEEAFGLAVDSGGRAFVTGYTYSENFPAKNGPQSKFGGQNDGFLSVISPDGATLLASTYFGGAGRDVGHGVAIGPAGSGEEPVLLVGSQDPPGLPGARTQSVRAVRHAPDGAKVYETLFRFRTGSPELVLAQAIDGGLDGIAYYAQANVSGGFAVAGQTDSASLATVNPIQSERSGPQDLFVQSADFSGNVRFSSYFGSSGSDSSLGVAADGLGNLWFAGEADAGDLKLQNAIPGYTSRGFLAKVAAITPGAPCVAGETTLCLHGSRFKFEAAWRIPSTNQSGQATMVPVTPDAGCAWFFSANSIELLLKVVDGRAFNNRFWIFSGALSNVEYTITVTDTVTGAVRTYFNPSGTLASFADLTAF